MNRAAAILIACVGVAIPHPARAYRPFDGTDAAVAATGELELELAPLGFLNTGPDRFLVAPGAVLNLGIVHDWELVLAGQQLVALDRMAGSPRFRLADTAFLAKHVVRDGCLQGGHGVSIAVELGALLPTVNDQSGIGGSAALIVSQQWEDVALHVNGEATLTRSGNLDLYGGAILEGPHAWAVRPVVEAGVERELGAGSTITGLVGAIWQPTEALAFDVAVRAASADHNAVELRAGLTWATGLWDG